jgi:hypothetical protein
VIYYVKAHIHEIISESGIDKNEHTNRVLRAIINGVETMPPINPQKWIPVSERLPEHSGNYLVTIADSNYENGQVFKISWFYPSDNRWSFKNANVLAWMPLPEPYKAESEES